MDPCYRCTKSQCSQIYRATTTNPVTSKAQTILKLNTSSAKEESPNDLKENAFDMRSLSKEISDLALRRNNKEVPKSRKQVECSRKSCKNKTTSVTGKCKDHR